MEVRIVYHNNGYEGMSKPLAVFKTEQLARIFVNGASVGGYTTVEYQAYEVIGDSNET